MEKTDRIIKLIREMISVGSGGFTGSADPSGPVAGYDPLISFKKGDSGKVDYRKVQKRYKDWVKSLEKSNARRQRRKT